MKEGACGGSARSGFLTWDVDWSARVYITFSVVARTTTAVFISPFKFKLFVFLYGLNFNLFNLFNLFVFLYGLNKITQLYKYNVLLAPWLPLLKCSSQS